MKVSPSKPIVISVFAIAAIAGGAILFGLSRSPVPVPGLSPSSREPEAYRAEVHKIFTSAQGSSESVEIVARRGTATRREWTEAGRRIALVALPDAAYVVDIDRNVFARVGQQADTDRRALDGEMVEALIRSDGSPGIVRRTGTEEVRLDGHRCQVVRVTIEGTGGSVSESATWTALDLGGLTIRTELKDADGTLAVTELRNITLDPDPALFALPAGAVEVSEIAPN